MGLLLFMSGVLNVRVELPNAVAPPMALPVLRANPPADHHMNTQPPGMGEWVGEWMGEVVGEDVWQRLGHQRLDKQLEELGRAVHPSKVIQQANTCSVGLCRCLTIGEHAAEVVAAPKGGDGNRPSHCAVAAASVHRIRHRNRRVCWN